MLPQDTSNLEYNPTNIKQYASMLFERAENIVLWSTLSYAFGGFVVGGIVGFFLGGGSSYNTGPGFFIALVGAGIGGYGGYNIGQGRALSLRLQAQLALCQMQTEFNTRSQNAIPAVVERSRELNPQPVSKTESLADVKEVAPAVLIDGKVRLSGTIVHQRTVICQIAGGTPFSIKGKGTNVDIFGRNVDASWLLIEEYPPLWAQAKDVSVNGNLADLPVVS